MAKHEVVYPQVGCLASGSAHQEGKLVAIMKSKPTYVDLFAGIGGFAAVFEALGLKNEKSVEFDLHASGIYKLNWGHDALGDVTKLSPDDQPSEISNHSVLSAGFPCQPFSKSGAQAGILDKSRGTLFHNILNTVASANPKLILLENVRNLAGPKHAKDLQTIIYSLRALGYRVSDEPLFLSPHKIPFEFGGRPQSRDRLFIVATYVGLADEKALHATPLNVPWLESLNWDPKSWDLYDFIDEKADAETALSEVELLTLEAWEDFITIVREHGHSIPSHPLWTDFWGSNESLDQFPGWKQRFIIQNQNFYNQLKKPLDGWLAKWDIRNPNKFTASKRKFEWQAGQMDSIYSGIVHFRPSGVRVKEANYFPALVAITQTPVLGKLRRRISVREAARLQGLPDWFTFGNQSVAKSLKQLGNGVNVGVVWNVLKAAVLRDRDWLLLSQDGANLVDAIESSPKSPDLVFSEFNPQGG